MYKKVPCTMLKKNWFQHLILLIYDLKIGHCDPIVGKAFKVRSGSYPFIVSLSESNNVIHKENHFCGGALISERHVLTCEHCIRDLEKDDALVIIRTLDFTSGQIYTINSWITYDEWALSNNKISENMENDIAIITLSEDVNNIEPAKISKIHENNLIGRAAVTIGWDLIDEANEIVPDTLLKVNLKILSPSEFRFNNYKLFKKLKYPESNFYYTLADPPAILGCGDSGGPLLLTSTKEIIAINQGSCNIKNPQNNPYAMSRHVKLLDEYREFIKHIKNQSNLV